MNFKQIEISEKLVPANYLKLAVESQKSKEIKVKELFEKRSLPEEGWSDDLIEYTVQQLANLDSNNFPHKAGLGEREARIACNLVGRRHYKFGHGIGRSGDLLEAQPKAVGSSILSQLTNNMLLQLLRTMGIKSCQSSFLVPLATGMTLTLCFLSLKKQRPQAKYILWSRIDQKSCFKSMTTAGFTPIIINPVRKEGREGLFTNLRQFTEQLDRLPNEEILCIMSTTSCFAPRNMDAIYELAELAKKYNVPHVVNNAYGLQSQYICSHIEGAAKHGRIDLFVQSTDKNLMVPVGGAIVAGFNEEIVHNVAKSYAGRASSSQTLDVFMTLLSLGRNGYLTLSRERKQTYEDLKAHLIEFADNNKCSLKHSKFNPISMALYLDNLSEDQPTKLGSMLYTRGISGTRVVAAGSNKTIDGYEFKNWGTHEDIVGPAYLTAAASLGLTSCEIEVFIKKLKECWKDLHTQMAKK
ncbi:O-phosphoseryl-tRNA(Sec) selenium transferase isoform X2 [Lucilia cuprina]|uniref:O-phosphoseryl-tRNA(Sec) selenium transferase isoform X2 n=1 Tax=Lucilia cuprina TaxID=7375 RepID=UPI001F06E7E5|nr:O-phosphoseryl-tRNA(Sec) selenium transferase isoform X2 [Lucilia cuprina]